MLLVPLSLLLLTGTIVAQSQQEEQKTQQAAAVKNEHIVMKDGKMLHSMDGKEMQMQNDMTLKNGTMIHPDGSYQLKNGKQLSLRNGQCMDMNGKKYRSQQMFQKRMTGRHDMDGNRKNMRMNGNEGRMMGTGGSHH
jgi:uncharacterized membrane protein